MISASGLLTAEQLSTLQLPNTRTELVRGQMVVREPAGYRHGEIAARALIAIGVHATSNNLGRVFAAETGFTLRRNPDTVRAADVAFIREERLPANRPLGFAEMAPDLAVEVLSPSDRAGEVLAKVADWLIAGTLLVWVIDPDRRALRVYRADGSESLLDADGAVDGEDVLPGLRVSVTSLVD